MQQNPLKSVRIHQGNDGLRPTIWWSVSSAAAWRSPGSKDDDKPREYHENTIIV